MGSSSNVTPLQLPVALALADPPTRVLVLRLEVEIFANRCNAAWVFGAASYQGPRAAGGVNVSLPVSLRLRSMNYYKY